MLIGLFVTNVCLHMDIVVNTLKIRVVRKTIDRPLLPHKDPLITYPYQTVLFMDVSKITTISETVSVNGLDHANIAVKCECIHMSHVKYDRHCHCRVREESSFPF